VALQQDDPGSVLAFYRRMIALRRIDDLRRGGTRWLDVPAGVLAYVRGAGTLCAFNLSDCLVSFRAPGAVRPHLAEGASCTGDAVTLAPLGLMIGALA
jgi:alpha-glucosidase